MKITKSQLKRIIKEELEKVLNEETDEERQARIMAQHGGEEARARLAQRYQDVRDKIAQNPDDPRWEPEFAPEDFKKHRSKGGPGLLQGNPLGPTLAMLADPKLRHRALKGDHFERAIDALVGAPGDQAVIEVPLSDPITLKPRPGEDYKSFRDRVKKVTLQVLADKQL